MSDSSQPKNSTINLDDLLKDLTININDQPSITLDTSFTYNNNMADYHYTSDSGDTITLTGAAAQGSYNISPLTTDQITILNGIDISSLNQYTTSSWSLTMEEFKDRFPDWYRIKDMCTKYPALDIALRNLRTVYDLVKSDYDSPKE